MRKRRADERFEIVGPTAQRTTLPKREFAVDGPALVPLRVIASAAPLARRSDVEGASALEVVLPDGTRLRFPASVTAAFIIEVISALRVSAC